VEPKEDMTMATRKDGDPIRLPLGWYIVLDDSTREVGFQGWVHSPNGRATASITAAIETGMALDASRGDVPIPQAVVAALAPHEEQYA
jgi:hypothetical protein